MKKVPKEAREFTGSGFFKMQLRLHFFGIDRVL
jgi:hypothetical protein